MPRASSAAGETRAGAALQFPFLKSRFFPLEPQHPRCGQYSSLELQLVARGHTYKQIGAELFIADKTVENHVRNILGKLRLSRKQELIEAESGTVG